MQHQIMSINLKGPITQLKYEYGMWVSDFDVDSTVGPA